MMSGLIRKGLLELRAATLVLTVLLVIAEALLAYVLPVYQRDHLSAVIGQSELAQSFLKALMGADAPAIMGPGLFMAFPWMHPAIFALTWAHAAIACTRAPVGELDRGTLDLLLGLPVSRWGLYTADALAWLATSLVMVGAMFLANRAGAALAPPELSPPAGRAALAAANLIALLVAVGGFSAFVSSLSDRRGRALTVIFIALLGSFLLNFLAQVWAPAKGLAWLGLLQYYAVAPILTEGASPLRDILILLAVGVAFWVGGGLVFARRNLAAA